MSAQQDSSPEYGGKGSFPRIWNSDKFRNNFDEINWGRKCSCASLHYSETCAVEQHARTARHARERAELEKLSDTSQTRLAHNTKTDQPRG